MRSRNTALKGNVHRFVSERAKRETTEQQSQRKGQKAVLKKNYAVPSRIMLVRYSNRKLIKINI